MSRRVELLLLWCFCCFEAPAVTSYQPERFRLIKGLGPCHGELQVKREDLSWHDVFPQLVTQGFGVRLCEALDCGSLLTMVHKKVPQRAAVNVSSSACEDEGSPLTDCFGSGAAELDLALELNCSEKTHLRLLGGVSRCEGELQVQRGGQDWTGVFPLLVPQWFGVRVCEAVACGALLAVGEKVVPKRATVIMSTACENSTLSDCFGSDAYELRLGLEVNCSDSMRLVGGRSLCSGLLQLMDPSSAQSWPSVCEDALGRRGAEVACRELGCGAPVLQGALPPLGQTFQCEGHESKLLDCHRNVTGPQDCPALNLTCSGHQGAPEDGTGA